MGSRPSECKEAAVVLCTHDRGARIGQFSAVAVASAATSPQIAIEDVSEGEEMGEDDGTQRLPEMCGGAADCDASTPSKGPSNALPHREETAECGTSEIQSPLVGTIFIGPHPLSLGVAFGGCGLRTHTRGHCFFIFTSSANGPLPQYVNQTSQTRRLHAP